MARQKQRDTWGIHSFTQGPPEVWNNSLAQLVLELSLILTLAELNLLVLFHDIIISPSLLCYFIIIVILFHIYLIQISLNLTEASSFITVIIFIHSFSALDTIKHCV